jgi:hypothetical protein
MTMDERRAELAKVAAVFRTRTPANTGLQTAHSVRNLTVPVCDLSVGNCPVRVKSAI